MKRQTRQVLDLLRLRGADGLTPAEARDAIACDRLAARIWELRHQHGIAVEDVRERSPMGATYSRYFIATPTAPTPMAGTQQEMSL